MNYPFLQSKRLILRQLKIEDKADIFSYRSDAIINQYQGWIPQSIKDVEIWMSKISTEFNTESSWAQMAILLQDNQTLIGDLGIYFIDKHQVEIGCTINKQYHQLGYAKEALSLIINYLLKQLRKHRITASIDPNNLASIKLIESLNFRKEAHFKKSLLINNTWTDDIIYAILNEEWQNKNTTTQ